MIYIGLIHFNDANANDNVNKLHAVLETYTQTLPSVVTKNSLILCYGKLSNENDRDEIWENDSAVLMGRLFDKTRYCAFAKRDFKNLSSLTKEEIFAKVWGKYVSIHANEKASQFDIVVDSTGQLPFFYYVFPNGNILFASDMEIIFKVLGQQPEINWTYLCSYISYGNSSAVQTPFQNIYELPPACWLKATKNERHTQTFWNPLSSYQSSAPKERNAVDVLQATLKPWIEPYKNICVSLSGGLDSSSLVHCLNNIKKEDQILNALNYFHGHVRSSNELIHARRVCEETGIQLTEIDMSGVLPFDSSHQKHPLNPNKPFPGMISLRWLETIAQHIPSSDSCTFLSGHGSDHIFICPPSKKSLSDYILEKGFKGSKRQLKNLTQFYRDSIFSIFKENTLSLGNYFCSRRLEKRHPKHTEKETPEWIKQELHSQASPDFTHPIYRTLPKKILPGKYDQIDALYEGLASIHMEMNHIHLTHYPFLYQPVIEFALSFPTYDLFDKGYDRYPLREAVRDYFKTETVWRRDKGETSGILQLGLKKNLDRVLELCLEGQFVKQGLIDKEGLRQTICIISNGSVEHLWHFIRLASAEIFFNTWKENGIVKLT